jgi:hypothetical protein
MLDEREKNKYLGKFRTGGRRTTKEQSLATEIWKHFDKQIAYPLLMRVITRYGWQWVFECYQHVLKAEKCNNPIALFLWRVKQAKIVLNEKPTQ